MLWEGKKSVLGIRTEFRFIYKAPSDELWAEHELDYALVVRNFTSALSENPDEVSDTKFVDQKELDEMMQKKNYLFSPWFSLFYKHKWLHQVGFWF